MATNRIERVSTMIEGLPCTVIIDGKTKMYKVNSMNDGTLYIQIGTKLLKEDDIPFGERVEI